MTIVELNEAAAAELKRLERLVRIEDGHIIFSKQQDYCVSLDRVGDEAAILRWAHHLAGKPWMTLPVLRHFIQLCCKHHHIDCHGRL